MYKYKVMNGNTENREMMENHEGKCKEDKCYTNLYNNKLKKYIHDIKNTKTFTKNTLTEINNLSYEERLEILINYNEMMKYFSSYFEKI